MDCPNEHTAPSSRHSSGHTHAGARRLERQSAGVHHQHAAITQCLLRVISIRGHRSLTNVGTGAGGDNGAGKV
eukprot:COSAG01_NODE_258_length_20077_cov_124.162429_14_plen_73_part_00